MLLYDGNCRFCVAGIAALDRWFRPIAPAVAADEELDAVKWRADGKELSGADAIAAWLRTGRKLRRLITLIPIGLPLGRVLYPIVARNRGRLSRARGRARR